MHMSGMPHPQSLPSVHAFAQAGGCCTAQFPPWHPASWQTIFCPPMQHMGPSFSQYVLSQKQSCSLPQPSGLLHATAPVHRGSGDGQPLLQYMHS